MLIILSKQTHDLLHACLSYVYVYVEGQLHMGDEQKQSNSRNLLKLCSYYMAFKVTPNADFMLTSHPCQTKI